MAYQSEQVYFCVMNLRPTERSIWLRAKIDGQLACTGGKFLAEGIALHCDAITVGADVLLSGEFEARGWINLNRAVIAGNLRCPAPPSPRV